VNVEKTESIPGDPTAADPQEIARLRVAIGRLHRRMVQRTSGNLTFSQTSALIAVEKVGPIRLGELAARERVAAPSMTRTVSGLVEAGLLHRAGDPQDGRSFLLSITDLGRAFAEGLRTERSAALAEGVAQLTREEYAALLAALPVLEHLAEQES
jgi:DNA-binding MarR family transcriptional regulator